MEEEKTESERNENKSKQNKKWIESLGFEHLSVEERIKNEEQMKNGEERRKIFMDLLMETSQKRYGSTSTWIFFMKTHFFHPK